MDIDYTSISLAAMALAIGMIASFSITQGIKSWRKEHLAKPLYDSTIKLIGRALGFICTLIAWHVVTSFLIASPVNTNMKAVGLAMLAAMLTPWVWQNWISLLSMFKPEWAKRLSGQDKLGGL
jgi:hypothetical protein